MFAPPRRKRARNFGTAVPFLIATDCHLMRGAAAYRSFMRTAMRISARNQIKGTVVEVQKGATTAHVRVDIGNGQIVTSAITNEAIDELGIKVKSQVTAVVKASDVMIAVD
jgi:molybdopterin-binding protein